MLANFEKTSQKIGQTKVAEVYYGVDLQTHAPLAVKVYNFTTDQPRAVLKELSVMQRLDHPNLIKFYDYYESFEQTVLTSELCHYELIQYIIEKKYYCEDDCRSFVMQFLQVLEYLHTLNTPHLNLKPENIFVKICGEQNSQTLIKIGDYNLNNIIPKTLRLAAPGFIAPEQILEQYFQNPYYNEPDIYTLGVITHLLLTGRLPFANQNQPHKLIENQLNFQVQMWPCTVSKNAVDFIMQCTQPIQKRPTAQQLLKHAWFSEEVPVIPLTGTQIQLKRYLASLRLKGGSSITYEQLEEIVKKVRAGIKTQPEEEDDESPEPVRSGAMLTNKE